MRKGQIGWSRGLTKETSPGLMAISRANKGRKPTMEERAKISKSRKGIPPWNKGLTKETNATIARVTAQNTGKTKGTDESVARSAANNKGRVAWTTGLNKETDERIKNISQKLMGHIPWNKGLTKDNNPIVASISTKIKGKKAWNAGLTKETNKSVESMAKITASRNKHNHSGLARRAEKMKAYVGEKSPSWIDGRSFIPYGKQFNCQIKRHIRERDNYICQNCGITEYESKLHFKRNLDVHHINYNKLDTIDNNLISLCSHCNIKANKDREFWERFYTDKIISKSIPIAFVIYG